MTDPVRRRLLVIALAAGGAGGLRTGPLATALAEGEVPRVGFEDAAAADAVEARYGTRTYAEATGRVLLAVDPRVGDGAIVPVSVESEQEAEEIAVVVEGGPAPLAAVFELPEGTEAYVSVRVRVRKESRVVALAKGRDGVLRGTALEVRARVPGFPD